MVWGPPASEYAWHPPHVSKRYMVITNTSTQGLTSEEVDICQQSASAARWPAAPTADLSVRFRHCIISITLCQHSLTPEPQRLLFCFIKSYGWGSEREVHIVAHTCGRKRCECGSVALLVLDMQKSSTPYGSRIVGAAVSSTCLVVVRQN